MGGKVIAKVSGSMGSVYLYTLVDGLMTALVLIKGVDGKWSTGKTFMRGVDPCRFFEVMGNEYKKGCLKFIKVINIYA